MNQWLGLGILLLGVGLGALLTRIADVALHRANLFPAEGKATNLRQEGMMRLHPKEELVAVKSK